MIKTKKQTLTQRVANLEKSMDLLSSDFNEYASKQDNRFDKWESGFRHIATDIENLVDKEPEQAEKTAEVVKDATPTKPCQHHKKTQKLV